MLSLGAWIALLLALVVGLSLGALGSGGSILALPILVYVAGVPTTDAVATSLLVVGGTALVGAIRHYQHGNFHLKAALVFSAAGIPAAYAGSFLTHLLPERQLLLLFAGLMMVAGWRMVAARGSFGAPGPCRIPRCLVVASAVGVLTGFLGVGGGFLILPALVLFAGVETKQAVGTSLAVITASAAAGFAGQLRHVSLDPLFAGLFLAAAILGLFAGIRLVRGWSADRLRRLFGWLIILLGGFMVAADLTSLPGLGP